MNEATGQKLIQAAGLMKSLSHPLRLSITCGLRQTPCTQTYIAEALDIPQPTVAQHLKVLRNQGVVKCERRGIEVVFSIANPMVPRILDLLCHGSGGAGGSGGSGKAGFAWCDLAALEKKRRVSGL